MLQETEDREEIIERVAALDIGKAHLVCCARIPHEGRPGRRMQEVQTYPTMTRSLLSMADHLRCLGVTRVVMEATSDYWKPAFYVLEAAGFETWLVNARDVKHLLGRPKTDKLDAVWLCKVAERQMIRPSFVPHPRSADYAMSLVTGLTWSGCAGRRRTGRRSCWRTPRSSSAWSTPTSSESPDGP
ncbi:IS110 family transposase [Streptomyces sp. HUAS TT20]|uniref:IS110 family transposase n=1 Tax=Streptomyces sp. HUAS TT20 TaxID=3447509 RepID=UPI0021DB5194|nr:transposase [Streptomyces sp. HUAS 15-9]UXY32143.1 transposase [Streptomyces sp. HUAS 15-9]